VGRRLKTPKSVAVWTVTFALVTAGGCARATAANGPTVLTGGFDTGGSGPRQVSEAEIARASARVPHSAADVAFMSGMISHHAQAVAMAGWAPTHGASASIRSLAERIAVSQTDEIALLRNWLIDRGEPVPELDPTGMKMVMNGVVHDVHMPGMLTAEQMSQLDQARGPDFDRLFLNLMIQHHAGAVSMVETLFDSVGGAQDETTFKFASDVFADQSSEIDRMRTMLDAMGPEPPPSPS
jgi:uncharacterized protein (DUF305 family)